MARPIPTSKPQSNGINGDYRSRMAAPESNLAGTKAHDVVPPSDGPEQWDEPDPMHEEMERLIEENHDIVTSMQAGTHPETAPANHRELEHLRAENDQLRTTVERLEQMLEKAQEGAHSWSRQQREYEALLDEKSEVIRELHAKIQELQQGAGASTVPGEDELVALSEELERDRRQLKDDEEALMHQMREMEVQMSRERAEFARQRSDIQRLHTEIRHELELAARDAALRERLAPLQRRHQELMNRRGATPLSPGAPATPPAAPPPPAQNAAARKDSGFIRRLFG